MPWWQGPTTHGSMLLTLSFIYDRCCIILATDSVIERSTSCSPLALGEKDKTWCSVHLWVFTCVRTCVSVRTNMIMQRIFKAMSANKSKLCILQPVTYLHYSCNQTRGYTRNMQIGRYCGDSLLSKSLRLIQVVSRGYPFTDGKDKLGVSGVQSILLPPPSVLRIILTQNVISQLVRGQDTR